MLFSEEKPKQTRIAVLGGGPTGLSAAYRLAREDPNIRVDVYESSSRFGGVVTTESGGGFRYELGPSSMNAKHAAVADLIYDRLKLTPHVQKRSAEAKNFFVVRDGTVHAMPRSPVEFCFSKILSWRAKLKVFREPFVAKAPQHEAVFESVAQFFERRFGKEIVDYIIDPAMAGIYSARPADMSMKHAFSKVWALERNKGSVIGGVVKGGNKTPADPRYSEYTKTQLLESFSFDDGMEVLTSSLVDNLRIVNKKSRLYNRAKVRTLDQDPDGAWRVNGRGKYDAIISTIPTPSLRGIYVNVSNVKRGFDKLAEQIKYAPVAIAVLGFKKSQIPARLDGFGVLLPSKEGRKMLGVNFTSSNFPERVEDPNNVFLTVYVGGARSPELAYRPAHEIVSTSTKELHHVLGIKGDPFYTRVKNWHVGIPQYKPGFDETLCTMARTEKESPGLFFGGNYRSGVGVPDALLSGITSAEKVLTYLKSR